MMISNHIITKEYIIIFLLALMISFPVEAQNILNIGSNYEKTDTIIFPFIKESLLMTDTGNKSDLEKSLRAGRVNKTGEAYLVGTCTTYFYESLNDSIQNHMGVTSYNEEGNDVSNAIYIWDESKNAWISDTKTNTTYHDNGINHTSYEWDTLNNEWVGINKNEYVYDDLGNPTNVESRWDSEKNDWTRWWKHTRFKDENGKDTLVLAYTWENLWDLNGKVEIHYDDFGNMITESQYYWNKFLNEWEIYTSEEWEYDSAGNLTLNLYYAWNDERTSWDCHSRHEYEYDVYGNLILQIHYNWFISPPGDGSLTESSKLEYTYDSAGQMVSRIHYSWDHEANIWIDTSKEEYEYTEDGDLSIRIIQGRDEWTTEWHTAIKLEYLSDEMGNDITINYKWDTVGNDWIRTSMIKYVDNYDTEGNTTYSANYYWDDSLSEWIPERKTFCNYGTSEYIITGDIAENLYHNITLYPNPTESLLNITGLTNPATISLYSVQGNLILQREVFNEQINIVNIPTGIYILILQRTNEHVLTSKIIKK